MAGKAEVKYYSDLISPAGIERLIEDLGFGAKRIDDSAITDGKLDLTVSQDATWSGFRKFSGQFNFFVMLSCTEMIDIYCL